MHCLPFAMRAGPAGVTSGSGAKVRNLKASNLPFPLGIVEFWKSDSDIVDIVVKSVVDLCKKGLGEDPLDNVHI